MAEARTVFSDASPLIALAGAGAFDLLRDLFGTVTVTSAVRREVLAGRGRPGDRELRDAIKAGWIDLVRDPRPDSTLEDLGDGEATTLAAAARARGRCLVIIDDPVARHRARQMGLAITGTTGILLEAKRRGVIEAVRPRLEALVSAGLRLSAQVVAAVLEDAGEPLEDEGS